MLIEVRSRRGRRLGLGLWPGGLCLGTAGGVYVGFLWRDNRANNHVPNNTKQWKENRSDRAKTQAEFMQQDYADSFGSDGHR